MTLTLVTAPTALPLTLHEVKAHLRIEDTDNEENGLLMGYLRAAVDHIDGRDGILGRALMAQTWDLKLDGFPCAEWQNRYAAIDVPLPPLQSVTSITYTDDAGDSQTLSSSLYRVLDKGFGKAQIVPAYSQTWPTTRDEPQTVTVRFVAGYSTVPEPIQDALLLLVGHFYANREPVNIGNIVSPIPMTVEALLEPYRIGVA